MGKGEGKAGIPFRSLPAQSGRGGRLLGVWPARASWVVGSIGRRARRAGAIG